MDDGERLAERLSLFLLAQLGDDAAVRLESVPRRAGGGSSKEHWAFDASWRVGGTRRVVPLLLRRDPSAGVVDTATEVEFRLLKALEGTPVPAPTALWADSTGEWLRRPFLLMERGRGRAARAALQDADPLALGRDGRARLAASLADALADLHAVDTAVSGVADVLPDPGADPGAAELERWAAELDAVELEPQPALRWVLLWLRDHVPPPVPSALVHGDARPANVLVHEGQLELLLDWELAHLGDPCDDLGWYTCSVYEREHTVPGTFKCSDFLARYCERSGREVNDDRLRFWQVLSTFRLAVIALTGVRNAVDGTTTRPAAAPEALVRRALRDALGREAP